MEPLQARESSARRLAIDLLGLGGVAFIGASATEVLAAPFFDMGVLFGAHVLLMGLALLAAILEWTRERLAETLAVATVIGGIVLTVVDVVGGVWYFAPFLGITTLLAIFALVNRFIVRDEARHQPRFV